MGSKNIIGWAAIGAVVLFVGYNFLMPSPPQPPVKETAGSKCLGRVAGQHAQSILARLEYLTKHAELFSSPETKLAERRETEAYCAQEAACVLLDEPDASQRKALYGASFSQCLDDDKPAN